MLQVIGCETLEELVEKVVPANIRNRKKMKLPTAVSEYEAKRLLSGLAGKNQVYRSFIGMGYHGTIVPPVIQRNVLENPGWYTQYTPYQAEIAQGRLEALLNFQTMVSDLTGMEIANASLLDEATAAAEAMAMAFAVRGKHGTVPRFLVSDRCHPQTIDVLKTRARPVGIQVEVQDHAHFQLDDRVFGVLVQYPATEGAVLDYTDLIEQTHRVNALAVVAADLLALTLVRPPGEMGADVVVGSAQRFGVPLGYGGPHAAFFATRDGFKRQMPGRLVGVSKDTGGRPALRLALQTREQHIRREKATSNICTAQVLLAIMASMYAVYHGPVGLKKIAQRVHNMACALAQSLRALGHEISAAPYFDTLKVDLATGTATEVISIAEKHRVNLRLLSDRSIGVSLDETTSVQDLADLVRIFNGDNAVDVAFEEELDRSGEVIPPALARKSKYLTHPVFNRHHSETEMLRYLKRLESRDLSLTTSMIPLGSCTMKLNAAAEMFPVSYPGFSELHPFAPVSQAKGYRKLFQDLEKWLAEITGFAAISLQPNAGSQGEYAGLLVIRQYHENRGQGHRNICLIPTSAHGTNPASAIMAGMKVVPVACDKEGNIDLADLRSKAHEHADNLAALMVTYPSTHGVFEEGITEICKVVHEHGGQVYMDGANLNAQVGLTRPAAIGADVCHLNLHKTFCIPHGGGGPGMGPIGVVKHLVPFLPNHPLIAMGGEKSIGAIAAAPWGSPSILPISYAYIAMMGPDGLTHATQVAIANANYIAKRIGNHFPVLYKGKSGFVAHECIIDLRQFKTVTVEDVAKRLMDYGFHAPTISWPVPGTMMIEPTESESKGELDRFCDAMIAIHTEIIAVENGSSDAEKNPLKLAPHTAEALIEGEWDRPYTREQGAYPLDWLKQHKFWPAVGRIDNVYGDRHPVCTCIGMEEFV